MTPRVRQIIEETAKENGLLAGNLLWPSRARNISHPRFRAIQRVRALQRPAGRPLHSLPQIASMFGMDHTSVIHALRRADAMFGPVPPVVIGGPVEPYDGEETRL